ncbi:hypothetical protein VTL71DRAFT_3751 [Oculimacula yallundae]|uniref:Uncharacterized protein n=1 Tax=Oculimacula yallundae TaxID=86028 RepID=A0ABR4C3X0_9HELO
MCKDLTNIWNCCDKKDHLGLQYCWKENCRGVEKTTSIGHGPCTTCFDKEQARKRREAEREQRKEEERREREKEREKIREKYPRNKREDSDEDEDW